MRQTAARLNRAWLTVIGVLLLLTGLAGLLIGTGLLQPTAAAAGLTISRPTPTSKMFGAATASAFGLVWVIVVTVVVAVIVGLLGLAWLAAQIPRTNQAKPFRLHDTAETGLTRCAPSVLTKAVESQIEALPGVQHAAAILRGTASQPDLTVKVTAGDRTNIPQLLDTLQNRIGADLGAALDTHLHRLGVQIEIDTTKAKTGQITI